MNAPRRWLDDTGDTGLQDLLRSGTSLDPPPGAQDDVWASLLTRLPPLPPPGGPPGDPSGSSSSVAGSKAAAAGKAAAAAKAGTVAVTGGVLKSALIGAGSAVVLLAGYTAVTPSAPDPSPPPPALTAPPAPPPSVTATPVRNAPAPSAVASATPSAEPSSSPRSVAIEPRPSAVPTTTPSVEPSVAAAERESMLREESRLVADARDALRRGDASGALGMLEQIRTKFPGGVLAQEREALTIEALARSGRKADAAARASAFVKAYPTSPLAARVQQFAN